MQELINSIQELRDRVRSAVGLLDVDLKKTKIKVLEEEMTEEGFWNDNLVATKISKELAGLKEEVEVWGGLQINVDNLLVVAIEAEKVGEETLKNDLERQFNDLKKEFENLEFYLLFSNVYDKEDCLVAIHAGTGGTDAMDWAEMLQRMILRYAENKKFKVNILDRSQGSEAGIKSVIMQIEGRYAYGFLKSEAGVHRLVRISPFDAEKMRHTSFALIEVLPILEETGEVDMKEEDIEIDTFRASGHGGQGVNTTDSAVRVKHKPTGITVSCQNQRSQLQNKETAFKILKSKLHQYYLTEQEEERQKIRGEYSEAVWGNQARSYVLHPYKLVKDHRTDYETQDVENILDGNLDELVESYLKWSYKNKQ